MTNRRRFLKKAGLISAAVPSFLTQTLLRADEHRDDDGRILVIIQLSGGNDGLNTVIPFSQDIYREKRPAIAVPKSRAIEIDDEVALHGSMSAASDLLQDGRLSIVQSVGYPNSDRSHFRSMAIWHTAGEGGEELPETGWAGRALDETAVGGTDGVFIGYDDLPRALRGRRASVSSLPPGKKLELKTSIRPHEPLLSSDDHTPIGTFVQRHVVDAYKTLQQLEQPAKASAISYPQSELGSSLRSVAQFIGIESSARVYYAVQPGYDTHESQPRTHGQLLSDFSRSLKAFLDDLKAMKLEDRVAVMAFSEFGRRVSENGSAGTDHGTAGPVFVAGSHVSQSLIGKAPDLSDLDGDDLKVKIDYRRVYAAMLDDWLGIPSASVLGNDFEPLPVFG
ncbi:MAG: DUF1501 domain-containing protein [Planctomycetota bacterium]